jgi:arginyl-tRNA synthetase
LDFISVIELAQENNTPHVICTYLEELSQQFNSFYADVPIITTTDQNLFISRITLIKSVAFVLENGLKILGIKMPPWM